MKLYYQMKTKILLVEDDSDLGAVIKQYLEFSAFEVTWFTHPSQLLCDLQVLSSQHLAILDVMLPEMNGFDLSKEIMKISNIPFLFLTAKGQSIDRILGLKLGAYDYISKPCEPEELLLRIQNILRLHKTEPFTTAIQIGNYNFKPHTFELSSEKKIYSLTEKETELLLLLSQHNQQIVYRKDILEQLWGENDFFFGRSLDVFMTRLRKYFKEDSRIKFESIRGVGYKIEFPV